MKRIDNSTATVDNKFTEGNPLTATPATILAAQWLNVLQEEVAHVIEESGGTLDQTGADTTQLYDAILALIAANLNPPVPAGTILPTGCTAAPTGYLLCYGQAVSRTTYSALYTAIGTTFGAGDGSTTFNLPDLRGRVVAGQDDMGGTSANRLTGLSGGVDGDVFGASGGLESHTLTTAQIPAHTHPSALYNVSFTSSGPVYVPTSQSGSTPSTIDANTGGGGAHNNVQPTLILNYMIKT